MISKRTFFVTIVLFLVIVIATNLFQLVYFSNQLKISWHKGFTLAAAERDRESQQLIRSLLKDKAHLSIRSLVLIRMILEGTINSYNYNLKYAKEELKTSYFDYLVPLEGRTLDAKAFIKLFKEQYGKYWENATIEKFIENERK